jgi:hypothetical protein
MQHTAFIGNHVTFEGRTYFVNRFTAIQNDVGRYEAIVVLGFPENIDMEFTHDFNNFIERNPEILER